MSRWIVALVAVTVVVGSFGQAYGTTHSPGSPIGGDFVLGPTTPGKWGGPAMGTSGGVVTYSFMATGATTAEDHAGGTFTHLGAFMPVGWKAEIVSAFAAWSAIADISFVEVADDGSAFNTGTVGDIRIGGATFDGPGTTLAHAYYPPVNGVGAAGDLHFDLAEAWKTGFGGAGVDIFQVAAHEIGHSIGLAHEDLPMVALMNPFYTEGNPPGLLADDIAGAVFIYGPSSSGVIPEPMTMCALSMAVAGLVGYVRKRKRG